MKQLRVSAIENGTVIDHIPPTRVFKIAEILAATESTDEVLIGTNLKSKKFGSKGVVKLSNIFLTEPAIHKIALLAAGATAITIKNYEVENKYTIKIPDTVVDIVRCFNPNCITNHEQSITKFAVVSQKPLKLHCHYCEKIMNEQQIEFRT